MNVVVNLPDALRADADGRVRFELQPAGATVGDVLEAMKRAMPAVHHRIFTEQGELRPHINVFVGNEDIRWSGGLATPVDDRSEVHFIPAVSGGSATTTPAMTHVAPPTTVRLNRA
ncbi:MAG TPA: ubiquitin-like small modifier protein 1 [Longimicrobiales bacterium]|nr:ubiquitin-like small modifier protein 1 [Longimicrobiales bacterium]